MNTPLKIFNIITWFAFFIILIIVAFFPQIHVNKEMLPITFIVCLINTLAVWSDN